MSRRARIALLAVAALLTIAEIGYLMPTDWFRDPIAHATPPTVLVHRAGAVRWPQNSLTALRGVLAAGAPGVELDLVLTADGVPVVSHDVWVHETLCTLADGGPVPGRVLIPEARFADLAGYRCGGVPDPEFPGAEVVAEPIATLDDVLGVLAGHPDVALYLDLKIEPPHTAPAADLARAVFERWRAAGLPNRLLVEAPEPDDIAALRAAAGEVPFTALLSTPPLGTQGGYTLKGMWARAMMRLSPSAPVERALAAGADGIIAPARAIPWSTAAEMRAAGGEVVIFGAVGADDLARYCTWPVTGIIVDDPAALRCP